MSARHACVVTSAHPIDDVRVRTKIVDSLLQEGWKVSWVGPEVTSHAQDDARSPVIDYSLFKPPSGRAGRLSSSFRIWRAAKRIRDVDWWYSPDPDAIRVATRLAREKGGRSVFDIHEVFHTGHLDRWTFGRRVGWLSRAVRSRVRASCRRSDLVIAVSKSVLEHYAQEGTTSIVVRNCAPINFADTPQETERDPEFLKVMHGKVACGNGSPVVLASLSQMSPAAAVEVVVFEGPEIKSIIERSNLNLSSKVQLTVLDRVPHEQMPSLTANCNLGLIAYQRDLGLESLPNRLFEYMAAGIAVLAPSYSPELRAVVEGEDIGRTCDFERTDEIAEQLEWFATHRNEAHDMGERARSAFLKRHNWEVEFGALLQHLSAV